MTVLSVDAVTKSFGGVVALQDVSMTIRQGQLFSVIGPNGAGKSTLFDIITGLTAPDAGVVRYLGSDVTSLRPDQRARLGMARTYQELRLFNDLTVFENLCMGPLANAGAGFAGVLFGTRRARQESAQAAQIAEDLLSRLGLGHRRNVAAGALSHGQKRLVEIGRALARKPKVLVLDEPTAGLNAANKALFLDVVLPVVRGQIETVLLVEHDMDVVMSVSDRVAVLAHGRKIAEGAPADVQANPDVIREYFGA